MFWRRRTPEAPLTPQERLAERVSAYIDDEVDETERVAMEALLASDLDARALAADFRMLSTALESLGEVRAPRSFAIPAQPATAPRPLALMRRVEWAMRASAATAALFFVVAVVNPDAGIGGTSNDASEVGATTMMQAAPAEEAAGGSSEALRSSDDGATANAPMPAAPESAPEEPTAAADSALAGGALADRDASAADTTGAAADASSGKADEASAAGGLGEGRETGPPGTVAYGLASESAEDVAPALGILAALLTAMSVLTAWDRAKSNARG